MEDRRRGERRQLRNAAFLAHLGGAMSEDRRKGERRRIDLGRVAGSSELGDGRAAPDRR